MPFGIDVAYKRLLFNIPRCGSVTTPDLNCDGRINIVDVSIMMYWFKKGTQPEAYVDLNSDGIINLGDFSILVFYWTG